MDKIKDNIIKKIETNKQLELKIKQRLIELGIKPNLKGFRYWTEAILYAIQKEVNGEDLGKIMEVYRYIGKKHKATMSKVERDMRYTVQNLDLSECFNVTYSISNTAFLFLLKEEMLKYSVSC